MTKRLLLTLILLSPFGVFANSATVMPDQAKADFMNGRNQVTAAECTGNGAPSSCCTAASTGASCPVYKMTIVTATATGATSSTTKTALGNEITCTGTCTGWAAGGFTLTAKSTGIASNHACWDFSTKTYSVTSATISGGRAVVIYNATTDGIVSIQCLDGTAQGGTCGTSSDLACTNGTCSVTIPSTVVCFN